MVLNNNLDRSMKEPLTANGSACVFVELKASELNKPELNLSFYTIWQFYDSHI